MRAVWLRVRTGLRQNWRSPVILAVITGLMGAVVLVALAGARRTDTAVSRFLHYSGPTEGQVANVSPETMRKIAALPSVGYSMRGALMLAIPVTPDGQPAAPSGQVLTWALIHNPPEAHAITVAGRRAVPSRATEVMINESAARLLTAGVGSVITLRGYRPDQFQQVLNGQRPVQPPVRLPPVHVVGIIRTPTDLKSSGAPADVTFTGTGSIYATAAFYYRFAGSVANFSGLSFHLKRGLASLPVFRAKVQRVAGHQVQSRRCAADGRISRSSRRSASWAGRYGPRWPGRRPPSRRAA